MVESMFRPRRRRNKETHVYANKFHEASGIAVGTIGLRQENLHQYQLRVH